MIYYVVNTSELKTEWVAASIGKVKAPLHSNDKTLLCYETQNDVPQDIPGEGFSQEEIPLWFPDEEGGASR